MERALNALVAELAANRALTRQPATIFLVGPAGIEVLKAGKRLLAESGPPAQALKMAIAKLGPRLPAECALEFAPGLAVTSTMVLPAESHDILKAIVRNKVESIAPWPFSQSLFGLHIAAIAKDPGHVRADVAVISRAQFEDIVAALAAAGTSVTAARVRLENGEALHIDFGSEDNIRAAQQRARRAASGVLAVMALFAAYGFFLVWQSSHELSQDRETTAALMEGLRNADAGTGGAPLLAALNDLHERRRQRPPAVAVLNELSTLLPQNVWVQSLSLDDAKLEIKGQGSNVPSLIDILEHSASFREVNFASATQLNEELNSDAFSIAAVLEQGPQAGTIPGEASK